MERRELWLGWIGEPTPSRSTGKICTPSLQKIRPILRKRRLYVTEGKDPNSVVRLGLGFIIRRQPRAARRHGQLSNSAWMRYPSPSQLIASTLGLQQTWQSSTYNCLLPPDSSTTVSFHSPQPAHWNPVSKGMVSLYQLKSALSLTEADASGLALTPCLPTSFPRKLPNQPGPGLSRSEGAGWPALSEVEGTVTDSPWTFSAGFPHLDQSGIKRRAAAQVGQPLRGEQVHVVTARREFVPGEPRGHHAGRNPMRDARG